MTFSKLRCISLSLLLAASAPAIAQDPAEKETPASAEAPGDSEPTIDATAVDHVDERAPAWYIGANPLAFVNVFTGYASGYMQFFSAEELGPAFSAGIFLSPSQALEARISGWPSNALLFFAQGSFAWKFFPFAETADRGGGFYAAPALRYGISLCHVAQIAYLDLVPSLELGWRFMAGSFYANIRVVSGIAALTFCSDPAIRPAIAWSFSPMPTAFPVLPSVGVDLGYIFLE